MTTPPCSYDTPKAQYHSLSGLATDSQDIAVRIHEARAELRRMIAYITGAPGPDELRIAQAGTSVPTPLLSTLEVMSTANEGARSALADLERDLEIIKDILM
ncbi:hypothetical protein CB1_95 [Pectobacterium phage vB_PatP_CB1]|uniref:Uncharacterized protein n=1 Tax=Pectobacterium phage vB_PatP_CB1 TaxID=1958917 RepID=A0A2P0PB78_9CAUD|nr:hypothetical protein HWB08_gp95 [Pectobacterium phage vB_PatP_CB1]ARB11822.1 hypothetical protein CB1_95 [Pectobacterium phage vB_PatP_CB1]